jgi:Flp pilus assembly pilin Flp
MRSLHGLRRRLSQCDEGATSIEYAVLASLIAVVLVASLQAMGGEVSELYGAAEEGFATMAGPPPAD